MLTGIEPRALAGGYFALTAYTIWGLAPIYFRAVGEVPPFEIIAHRVVWSVVLLLAVLAVTRQMGSQRWQTPAGHSLWNGYSAVD